MYTITHGIGVFSDIPHFILRGLVPGLPEGAPTEPGIADPGILKILFSLEPSQEDNSSDVIPLGDVASEITWQTKFESVPDVASILLELSIDGVNFSTGDESTNVGGEIRTLVTAARFVRVTFGDMDSEIQTTVTLVAKQMGYWPL